MRSRLLLSLLLLLGLSGLAIAQPWTVPPGSTFRGNADGSITVTPPAPPPTYPLTLPVTGSGSTAGAGSYGAAAPVTIAATPAAGQAFKGWSGPAPCPQGPSSPASFAMPATALECRATFEKVPDPPIPPATGTGSYRRLIYSVSPYRPYYWHAFVIDKPGHADHGKIWLAWNGTSYLLDPAGPSVVPIGTTPTVQYRENFGSDFDPVAGVGWIGAQASKPTSMDGVQIYDATARTYTAAPTVCPSNAVMAADPDRNKLFCFAGWRGGPLYVKALNAPQGAWALLNPTPSLPAVIEDGQHDGARLASLRGGIDRRNGHLWIIHNDQELWDYDPGANQWTLIPTSGTKPPNATVFALHEAANTIVGFSGCAELNDPCATLINRSWLLDLASKQWRPGPTVGQPSATVLSRYVPLYHRARRTVIILTGSDGLDAFEWTPDSAPNPAPVPLTVAKAGTGDGMVSGAGSYLPGTAVTVSATPDSSSTLSSLMPRPCDQKPTFPMPATALACTATFAKKPVDPPMSGLPAKTFVARAGGGPFKGDAKDINSAELNGVLVMGAGDEGNSGRGPLWTYDGRDNSWALLVPECVPSSVSPVQMNHPSDRGPMIGDRLGALWNWNGVPFPDQNGSALCAGGAIQRTGLLRRDPSGAWALVTPDGPGSLGGGAYDSTADAMLYFVAGGCGSRLLARALADGATQALELCVRPSPAWSTATGGWEYPNEVQRSFFAWDDAARRAYAVAPVRRFDAAGGVVEMQHRVFGFDRATGAVTMGAAAPAVPGLGRDPYAIRALWDPAAKRVLWPVVLDGPCGTVAAMLAYDPAADAWETFAVPAGSSVYGNSAAFDPRSGAVLIAGRVFCGSARDVFLWRY